MCIWLVLLYKPIYWERNLSHCHFVDHKPHTGSSGNEPGPLLSVKPNEALYSSFYCVQHTAQSDTLFCGVLIKYSLYLGTFQPHRLMRLHVACCVGLLRKLVTFNWYSMQFLVTRSRIHQNTQIRCALPPAFGWTTRRPSCTSRWKSEMWRTVELLVEMSRGRSWKLSVAFVRLHKIPLMEPAQCLVKLCNMWNLIISLVVC